jgi:nucleoside-diphosphate-sugar epimerase
MRELVLGGAGLVGTALGRLLRERGHHVVSLDLKTGCDLAQVNDAPFETCDRVWFLAWDVGGAKYMGDMNKQHQQYLTNCNLCARVFDALARTRKPFLFATSQLAGLRNAYGLTKLLGEEWAAQLGGKLARLWNAYGWEVPDHRSHVIPDMALAGLMQKRIRCMTSGAERRRFLFVDDTARGLIGLFESSLRAADFGGPEWVPIRDVVLEVAGQLGVEAEFGPEAGTEVMVAPQNLVPGWRPQVSLPEGIGRVIADARRYLAEREANR